MDEGGISGSQPDAASIAQPRGKKKKGKRGGRGRAGGKGKGRPALTSACMTARDYAEGKEEEGEREGGRRKGGEGGKEQMLIHCDLEHPDSCRPIGRGEKEKGKEEEKKQREKKKSGRGGGKVFPTA